MNGIADAKSWANDLVRRESRGPGDMENAMHRLEARYGIPWRTFWQLRYRPPADVFVSVYLNLKAAYDAESERQERLLRHDRDVAQAKAMALQALARAGTNCAQHQDHAGRGLSSEACLTDNSDHQWRD